MRRLCDIPPSTVFKTYEEKREYCDVMVTAKTRRQLRKKALEIKEKIRKGQYVSYSEYDSDYM